MLIIVIMTTSFAGFYFIPGANINRHNESSSVHEDPEYAIPAPAVNSTSFWMFVILMSLGTINFNVGNCVSDSVCFDVLGENNEMKYGQQRVWGTIGFGLTALIGGIAVDLTATNSLGPALVVMLICIFFDLASVTKLKVNSSVIEGKEIL